MSDELTGAEHDATAAPSKVRRRGRYARGWHDAPALLIVGIAGLFYARDLSSVARLHPDEALWILSAKISTDLALRQRDLDHPFWEHPLRTWGCHNPQVGKYLLGLSLQALAPSPEVPDLRALARRAYPSEPTLRLRIAEQTIGSAERLLGFSGDYDFSQRPSWNAAHGRAPPPDVLRAARTASVVAGLIAGLLLYLVARRLQGPLLAVIVLALFLFNPVIDRFSRVATTDILVLLFVLAGTLGLVWSFGQASIHPRARALLALGTGTAWGLAISTKLSALAPWLGAVSFCALACSLAVVWRRRRVERPPGWLSVRDGCLLLACLTVLPGAIFVASNPFLYEAPLEPYMGYPTRFLVPLGLDRLMATYEAPGKILSAADTVNGLTRFLVRYASNLRALGSRWALEPIAFLVGLGVLARGSLAARRRVTARADWAVFLWISAVTWAATISWLPFSWPRLYIPLLPFYLLVSGLGLSALVRVLKNRAQRCWLACRRARRSGSGEGG